MSESQLIAVVEDAARRGSWNAAAWLLERRFPERWLKATERRLPKPPREPKPSDEDKAFAEIIELARRRTD